MRSCASGNTDSTYFNRNFERLQPVSGSEQLVSLDSCLSRAAGSERVRLKNSANANPRIHRKVKRVLRRILWSGISFISFLLLLSPDSRADAFPR